MFRSILFTFKVKVLSGMVDYSVIQENTSFGNVYRIIDNDGVTFASYDYMFCIQSDIKRLNGIVNQ